MLHQNLHIINTSASKYHVDIPSQLQSIKFIINRNTIKSFLKHFKKVVHNNPPVPKRFFHAVSRLWHLNTAAVGSSGVKLGVEDPSPGRWNPAEDGETGGMLWTFKHFPISFWDQLEKKNRQNHPKTSGSQLLNVKGMTGCKVKELGEAVDAVVPYKPWLLNYS